MVPRAARRGFANLLIRVAAVRPRFPESSSLKLHEFSHVELDPAKKIVRADRVPVVQLHAQARICAASALQPEVRLFLPSGGTARYRFRLLAASGFSKPDRIQGLVAYSCCSDLATVPKHLINPRLSRSIHRRALRRPCEALARRVAKTLPRACCSSCTHRTQAFGKVEPFEQAIG